MPSLRKRKLAAQDSTKKKHVSEKRRKGEAEQLQNRVEDVASPSLLTSKSVLSLRGDMSDSCLLFLERCQVICMKGKVQVRALFGVADVFGYKLKSNSGPVNVFSSATSSLLAVTECSGNNLVKRTGLRIAMVKALRTQSREIIKRAVTRAKNVSSVLLLKSLQTVEVEFICGIEHFQDVFHFNSGKEICHTKAEMVLKKKTAPLGFLLLQPGMNRFGTLKVPGEWSDVLLSVQKVQETATDQGFRAPVVLICGGKDVGKSTFARFLINSLLNRCLEVYFLECDVGQTEFTPPGIISLNKVCSPLLGPPFSHLSQPERAVFFGDVSPKDKPGFYIKCVNDVHKKYAEIYNRKIPLIINTQGWVKGMGLPLLLDIIRLTEPTHVVQFSSSSQPNKNLPVLTHEFLADASGWAFPLCEDISSKKGNAALLSDNQLPKLGDPCQVEPVQSQPVHPVILQLQSFERSDTSLCKLGASDYRTLALLAYFSGVCKLSCSVLSLFEQIPYRVPWSQVAVHVMHTEVPWNQVLYSLNASVVGLAHLSAEKMMEGEKNGSAPYALQETPIAGYFGLGIVRNIDPTKRLFYILTPVPAQTLQQVNTLLKGNLELPAKLLQTAKQSNVPYVSSNFSYDLRGAGARKVRYNLLRRNPLQSPGKTS